MAAIRNVVRWIAWQIIDHESPANQPPAHITVLSAGGVEDF
ncbi:MAG TPA: hypothetical protein VMF57_12105 [Solirubrobacteraceae bacterium]|nr:hypothetical protein [Solirubrobacteraceae bacterium]